MHQMSDRERSSFETEPAPVTLAVVIGARVDQSKEADKPDKCSHKLSMIDAGVVHKMVPTWHFGLDAAKAHQ
jgi:hypothetical protein